MRALRKATIRPAAASAKFFTRPLRALHELRPAAARALYGWFFDFYGRSLDPYGWFS
jgi:hypothetical protein